MDIQNILFLIISMPILLVGSYCLSKTGLTKDQRKNLRVFFFKHTTSSVYIKRMPYLLPL